MTEPKPWRIVTSGDPRPMSAVELIPTISTAMSAWKRLTRIQRDALTNQREGRVTAKPQTLAALHRHGITDESGALTEAGHTLLRWGMPVPDKPGETIGELHDSIPPGGVTYRNHLGATFRITRPPEPDHD